MYVFVSALVGDQFKRSIFGKPLNNLACGMAFKLRCIWNPAKCNYEFLPSNEYQRISSPSDVVNPYLLRSLSNGLTDILTK